MSFPQTIYSPRTIANRPGVVFDPDDTKTFFAEDLNLSNDEILAIESWLQHMPEGTVWNGKIAVSVANYDLTVAIKTDDGGDPSASDPVAVKIDGVVRWITAALSFTLNDATNWFNSGGAEHATKEDDYFAYLGYNATDGVVLGIGLWSYMVKYDDFSTTNTSDLYGAFSTVAHASASDPFTVIGRFTAILSATANFRWSVPAFTRKNLIQSPIYVSRWLDYVPTYSCNGTMTITQAVAVAKFRKDRATIFVETYTGEATIGGTLNNMVYQTLPYPAYGGWDLYFSAGGYNAGGQIFADI